jgi:glucokinase
MGEYSIGLDLGGTNLRAAAMDRAGHVLDRRAMAANPAAGRETMLSQMASAIAELRQSCGTDGLAGIGIGVPGFILLKEGIIRNSNNLACLEDFPIRTELERRLNTHVILENDANAAALGEKWLGAGRDVEDLVLLTLGTGVGGGLFRAAACSKGIWEWPANWATSLSIRTGICAAAAIKGAWRSMPRRRRSRQWLACFAWAKG